MGSYFYDRANSNIDRFNPLVIGSNPVANSTKAQFLYDVDDGRLLFDNDGIGTDLATHIMTSRNSPGPKHGKLHLRFLSSPVIMRKARTDRAFRFGSKSRSRTGYRRRYRRISSRRPRPVPESDAPSGTSCRNRRRG